MKNNYYRDEKDKNFTIGENLQINNSLDKFYISARFLPSSYLHNDGDVKVGTLDRSTMKYSGYFKNKTNAIKAIKLYYSKNNV